MRLAASYYNFTKRLEDGYESIWQRICVRPVERSALWYHSNFGFEYLTGWFNFKFLLYHGPFIYRGHCSASGCLQPYEKSAAIKGKNTGYCLFGLGHGKYIYFTFYILSAYPQRNWSDIALYIPHGRVDIKYTPFPCAYRNQNGYCNAHFAHRDRYAL